MNETGLAKVSFLGWADLGACRFKCEIYLPLEIRCFCSFQIGQSVKLGFIRVFMKGKRLCQVSYKLYLEFEEGLVLPYRFVSH